MTRSDKLTKWLLVHAECGDDYQCCVAAIVKIEEGELSVWEEWLYKTKREGEDSDRYLSSTYSGADVEYIESLSEEWEELLAEEGQMWIEEFQEEDEDYTLVEDRIWGNSITVSRYGTLQIESSGKDSGINYWTVDIDIEKLKEEM